MSFKERVLVIEDETNARRALCTVLAEEGFEVEEARDGEESLRKLAAFAPAVVLCDLRMPKLDGLAVLKHTRQSGSDAAFIMMTAFASVEGAVEAIRAGAENYLIKPLDMQAVLILIEKVLQHRRLIAEAATLRERVRERFGLRHVIGASPDLKLLVDNARRAAHTEASMLFLGEAGTGKRLLAQSVHEESQRRGHPLLTLDCAALGESPLAQELFGEAFEPGPRPLPDALRERAGGPRSAPRQADGGTLLLEEIGELPLRSQAELLDRLKAQEGRESSRPASADLRLLATSRRTLAAEVAAGRFLGELLRHFEVTLTLPPLRRRKGDLPILAGHFVERFSRRAGKPIRGLAPDALDALLAHDWPGNVRELEHTLERAVDLCAGAFVTPTELPRWPTSPRAQAAPEGTWSPGASLQTLEREAILRTLALVGGSTVRAAEVLGISVRKIQYRLKSYGETDATTRSGTERPRRQRADGGTPRGD